MVLGVRSGFCGLYVGGVSRGWGGVWVCVMYIGDREVLKDMFVGVGYPGVGALVWG